MKKCLISPQDLHKLENCECTDPFLSLGYHHIVVSKQTLGIIRVFNPQFQKVEILWEDQSSECEYASGTGCFECLFPSRLEFFPYRIRATTYSGEKAEYEDPYSILPVLSDYDIH